MSFFSSSPASNGSGPFGNPEYETEDVFDLVKVNGRWLVQTAPWRLAICLVWAAVWGWQRWMWLHPAKGPGRLAEVPTVAGSVFGLLIGAGGAVRALGALLDSGLQGFTGTHSIGAPWWAGGEYVLVVVGRNALIDVIPLAGDSLKGMPLKGMPLPGTAGSGNGLLFDR